jgi:Zn-finger nucleic acid-binding protein
MHPTRKDDAMLTCPACKNKLQILESEGVQVDACVGHCGGVWFDNRELQQVDESFEHAGEAFMHIARDPDLKPDMKSKRHCPVCLDIVMMRHFFSVKRKIEVDECAKCGGVWLDADELESIRGEYKDTQSREAAADDLFHVHFDQELATMKQESQQKVARASRFASMFQWICPSRYIAGKQDGAAF